MSIEQLDALRTFTVHLTSQGYESLALGLVKEVSTFFEGKMKGKYKYVCGKICEADWRGFVSSRGIGRTSQKTIKNSNYGARFHPYKPSIYIGKSLSNCHLLLLGHSVVSSPV
jgi:hypothetical protein